MLSLLGMLLIGLVAGSVAAWLMGSTRPGWIPTMVVGVLGSFVGGFLFRLVGFTEVVFPASLVPATVGAAVCIWLIRVWGKKL
ncbi:MAG: GlsB/YeaQ/YmgE family stress response membrane protein [Planctomycetota bacterium]